MTTKVYNFMKMFLSFKEYEIEGGKLVIDELKEGAEAMILGEGGEMIPATDGEYVTEDGKITIADGKVANIEVEQPTEEEKPAEEEKPVEEAPIEEPKEDEAPTDETTEEVKEEEPVEEVPNPALEEANSRIAELEALIAEKDARIAELEAELNKPIDEPIEMKATVKDEVDKSKKGVLRYFED